MLVEVVANHFGQCCLTRSGFTYYNCIDAQTDIHDVLTRMQVSIGINNRLQLLFHIAKSYHAVKHVLRNERFTTPPAELGY